jgi:hypothetical protein
VPRKRFAHPREIAQCGERKKSERDEENAARRFHSRRVVVAVR